MAGYMCTVICTQIYKYSSMLRGSAEWAATKKPKYVFTSFPFSHTETQSLSRASSRHGGHVARCVNTHWLDQCLMDCIACFACMRLSMTFRECFSVLLITTQASGPWSDKLLLTSGDSTIELLMIAQSGLGLIRSRSWVSFATMALI